MAEEPCGPKARDVAKGRTSINVLRQPFPQWFCEYLPVTMGNDVEFFVDGKDYCKALADGARTTHVGEITLTIMLAHVADVLTATDAELVEAMRFFAQRMKIVVEPTGALAAAGLFKGALDVRGKRVGVVISGGNVDLKAICKLIT